MDSSAFEGIWLVFWVSGFGQDWHTYIHTQIYFIPKVFCHADTGIRFDYCVMQG